MYIFVPRDGDPKTRTVVCDLVKKRKDAKKGPSMWWAVLSWPYKPTIAPLHT